MVGRSCIAAPVVSGQWLVVRARCFLPTGFHHSQELDFGFGGAAADGGVLDVAVLAAQVTIALVERDDAPFEVGEGLPEAHPFGVGDAASLGLPGCEEWLQAADAGDGLRAAEAPGA